MPPLLNRLNRFRRLLLRAIEAYSPVTLALLIIPFFLLSRDHVLHRRLLLYGAALPGILLCLLTPKRILKHHVFWIAGLFILYFSVQDMRGLLPLSFSDMRWQIVRASSLFFPLVLLSRIVPRRRLYPCAVTLVSVTAAGRVLYELILFYKDNPFPEARFLFIDGDFSHITLTAMLCGFSLVLTLLFLLQNTPVSKHWKPAAWICLPVLLTGMLLTHSRGAFMAFSLVLIGSLFMIRSRLKKTAALVATVLGIVTIYFIAVELIQTASPTAEAPSPAASSQLQKPEKPENQRPGGVFVTGERGTRSITHRLDMWEEHLSRQHTEHKWLFGFGLGMNQFVEHVAPKKQYLYYTGKYGWEIHTHSGYIWALYFGGAVGLILLTGLLCSAFCHAVQQGETGLPAAGLLLFAAAYMLVDTKSLLVGSGSITYLLFWIPIGLAAAEGNRTAAPSENPVL